MPPKAMAKAPMVKAPHLKAHPKGPPFGLKGKGKGLPPPLDPHVPRQLNAQELAALAHVQESRRQLAACGWPGLAECSLEADQRSTRTRSTDVYESGSAYLRQHDSPAYVCRGIGQDGSEQLPIRASRWGVPPPLCRVWMDAHQVALATRDWGGYIQVVAPPPPKAPAAPKAPAP